MYKKDLKLFASLVAWMLIPSLYMLVRMNVAQVNALDFNILGQMEWFDLIDEVIVTALTVPLYSLFKESSSTRERTGSAFIFTFGLYCLFAAIVVVYMTQISGFMGVENDTAYTYLKLQTISLLIGFIGTFSIILLTLHNKFSDVATLTISKLALLSILDCFLIGGYAEWGAAYSDIIANSIIAIAGLLVLGMRGLISFKDMNFDWLPEFLKVGGFAGGQIFLDNVIYAVMICKMVNAVSESGNYWVANNFIWGWLLIPATCIMEIIKKNNDDKLEWKTHGLPMVCVAAVWLITLPAWDWFLQTAMAVDTDEILHIVYLSAPFYLTYFVSGVIDSWFIAKGKTMYNTVTALIVNVGYYGLVYLDFQRGYFTPDMTYIIIMFGFGMIVHMVCSIVLYRIDQKIQAKKCKAV